MFPKGDFYAVVSHQWWSSPAYQCVVVRPCSSHAVTSDVSLAEMSRAAEFFCSDGLVITGVATGDPVRPSDLPEVSAATTLPVVLGSGVTVDNVDAFMGAHAFIVGSHFKKGGLWWGSVDADRVGRFMERVHHLRAAPTQTVH